MKNNLSKAINLIMAGMIVEREHIINKLCDVIENRHSHHHCSCVDIRSGMNTNLFDHHHHRNHHHGMGGECCCGMGCNCMESTMDHKCEGDSCKVEKKSRFDAIMSQLDSISLSINEFRDEIKEHTAKVESEKGE